MPKKLDLFLQQHFFALQQAVREPDTFNAKNFNLAKAFLEAGFETGRWEDFIPEMEAKVGATIDLWHAGHLAKMKGAQLPEWDKRDVYIAGIGKTKHLEELQRQAADTLAKMKFAFIRETLHRHAQLYDLPVQSKMDDLLKEMQQKAFANPLAFLDQLAHRQFVPHKLHTSTRPDISWAKNDKTTELVCQLANLTYLQIQNSLQPDNTNEQNNVPTCAVTDISMR